jgi:NADPH:quinone reductase-like Zn-dependent oxidoreductase
MMKYKRVIVTRRGGPEVLKVIDNDLRAPFLGEVRVKNLSVPVCLPDVEARYGHSPFKLKVPFVPGYAIIGSVDAIGDSVTEKRIGERVAALTVSGGYAEYIYLKESELIPVPVTVDLAEAAPVVLNYIVAYQVLHRLANVKSGDKVLIIGASGGIGTAFLQLGKLAELKMYGLASPEKHHILREYDAVAIDYHTEDFVKLVRGKEPGGLNAVFDGVGGSYVKQGFSLLRSGGIYVGYSNPLSLSNMLRYLGLVMVYQFFPNGRSAKFYGTGSSRLNRQPFIEDWAVLFELLEREKFKPIIAAKYPILEAAKANEHLESGSVVGNIVLLAPELI